VSGIVTVKLHKLLCGVVDESRRIQPGYVPHSPCRSGVGGCSSGGAPLSLDESLLHEFTLFRGEKKLKKEEHMCG
jgi:hypothetical protein